MRSVFYYRERTMNFDAKVLRIVLQMARAREAAREPVVAARAGTTRSAVRRSMRRLQAAGFVDAAVGSSCRLTMAGLAIAVAAGARPQRRNPASRYFAAM
jgi:hypothetical protein